MVFEQFSKKEQKVIKFLRQIAKDNVPIVGTKQTARLSAAIVVKGDIISLGFNQMKTHPLAARFSKHDEAVYQHAEINAIVNAFSQDYKVDLSNATLFVQRVKRISRATKDMQDGMAKPCKGCMAAIEAFGFKRVVYSTDEDGHYEQMIRSADYAVEV